MIQLVVDYEIVYEADSFSTSHPLCSKKFLFSGPALWNNLPTDIRVFKALIRWV